MLATTTGQHQEPTNAGIEIRTVSTAIKTDFLSVAGVVEVFAGISRDTSEGSALLGGSDNVLVPSEGAALEAAPAAFALAKADVGGGSQVSQSSSCWVELIVGSPFMVS
jgi:hypothetical protein